ncbi:gem-associated protein 2-like [Salvia hispanica]|uniref:gem-associated protein 2-like n=1 Tax=Salvia hispanica TaxID=49212 RepID=UPI002009499B|nr:gem-associated protein 2-like [Salvia hispanica]
MMIVMKSTVFRDLPFLSQENLTLTLALRCGLEYLRRVRWEAARIPKVKVVKVNKVKEQSVYMPQIPDVIKCPEKLLPLKQWEDSFLSDFSQLREAFARLDLEDPSAETSAKRNF